MTQRPLITRAVPLIDLEVGGGDGRTVTAYAATFDTDYEVRDHQGHYYETINRAAFNRQIGLGLARTTVLFNHGLTAWGTPSERYSDPIGVPESVRAEAKGLLTVTRYGTNDLAEQALAMINDGSVTTYSFRGPVFRSAPARRHASGLTLIERTELGLTEYGPAIIAVNEGAKILAVRSAALIAEEIAQLTDEERAALLEQLSTPPAEQEAPGQESTDDPPAEEEAPDLSLQIIELLEAEAANRRRRLEA